MKKKLLGVFPAFEQKNYRLYFAGQLISLIGTWLHIVAEGWLVLQLTHSAFWVGTIVALGTLPVLLFSFLAGPIIDRYSKKKILYWTQSIALVIVTILGILTLTNIITVWMLAILAFSLGMTKVFDMPARQSFMTEMIEKKYLSSALAINAGVFNSARAIGPAVAGILLALVGPGGVFIINGLSFLFGILALFFIKQFRHLPNDHTSPLKSIKHGLSYTFQHPHIKYLLVMVAMTAIFGWSYGTILPVVVAQIYHRGAETLGYFHSSVGFGAILAAITISAVSQKLPVRLFVFGANMILSISLVLLTLVHTLWIVYFILFFIGFSLVMQFSTINTVLHHEIDDSVRGRVMSIFTFMSVGLMPVGSFIIGLVSEFINPYIALRINALILISTGLTMLFLYSKKQFANGLIHRNEPI